ncbi:MAG TPA: hypothetical protein VH724_06515 [Candidatus Angelobacter sp.]|jgi:hypothetical protein|nr:hypothetical protein [Candidatus Angelobacter sp.]
MTEDPSDDRIETYLRQFRPHLPRPLPGRSKVTLIRWRVPLRVAAAVAFALSIALVSFLHKVDRGQSPQTVRTEPLAQETSFIRLSRASREDNTEFDARMDSLSVRLLPDVRRSQGILKALAHE